MNAGEALRMIGLSLIFLSFSLTGIALSARERERLRRAEALYGFLSEMELRIRLYSAPLSEICASFSDPVLLRCGAVAELRKGELENAFLLAGDGVGNGCLDALRRFARSIGSGGYEESVSACKEILELLGKECSSMKASLGDRTRLYTTLGLCAGAAAVILLI